MPTLIVEQPEKRTGGPINGRVLIGRLPTNGIVVNESTVSRLHAWIDRDLDGHYFVGDGGSLAGTLVNGRAVARRKVLEDGDVVRVGQTHVVFSTEEDLPPGVIPVNLGGKPPSTFTEVAGVLFNCRCGAPVWFKAAAIGQAHVCRHCSRTVIIPGESGVIAETVKSAEVIEPGMPPARTRVPPVPKPYAPPIEEIHALPPIEIGFEAEIDTVTHEASPPFDFETAASPEPEAPLDEFVRTTQNGHVHESENVAAPIEGIELPERHPLFQRGNPSAASFPPAMSPADSAILSIEELTASVKLDPCSICHSPIAHGEETTTCPSCGLTFHADCWNENYGCSAYGCAQVNVLKPAATEAEVTASDMLLPEEDPAADGFPWEFVFMVMSVAGSLLGALAYGVPAMIAALGTVAYLGLFDVTARRKSIALVALCVCLLGAGGGLYLSYLWWNGWPIGRSLPGGIHQ